jgi:hypothetical protein
LWPIAALAMHPQSSRSVRVEFALRSAASAELLSVEHTNAKARL